MVAPILRRRSKIKWNSAVSDSFVSVVEHSRHQGRGFLQWLRGSAPSKLCSQLPGRLGESRPARPSRPARKAPAADSREQTRAAALTFPTPAPEMLLGNREEWLSAGDSRLGELFLRFNLIVPDVGSASAQASQPGFGCEMET